LAASHYCANSFCAKTFDHKRLQRAIEIDNGGVLTAPGGSDSIRAKRQSIFTPQGSGSMPKKTSRKRKTRQSAGVIFDSIRKPTAPPGHPLSHAKPEEKARPAGRKAKHKQKPESLVDEDS
jgi:hypothetical protein